MNMFSLAFICLWTAVLILLKYSHTAKMQNKILLLASILFYANWDARFLLLLAFIIFTAYYAALNIKKRLSLYLGIGVPLLVLGIFKYLDFGLQSFCLLTGLSPTPALNIILPLGISFYIFLAISYVLDVYKGKIAAKTDFISVALYISFFPTIVSGPITKGRDLLPQLENARQVTMYNFSCGVQRFVIGCIKKFVIADNLAIFVNAVYAAPAAYDTPTVWLAVISFSLQLYFDFAGYSDMAIGVARTIGIKLSENFNLPYISKNISEFWKRWHISLSSFLQEYLYFSLGGSRRGKIRTYVNLILTMSICGIWHGAGLNFILWGFIHGILLCIHHLYRESWGRYIKIPAAVNIFITFFSVTIVWIFFRATSFANALEIFTRLFVINTNAIYHPYILSLVAIFILLAASIYTVYHPTKKARFPLNTPLGFFVLIFELYILFGLRCGGNTPFVYANF